MREIARLAGAQRNCGRHLAGVLASIAILSALCIPAQAAPGQGAGKPADKADKAAAPKGANDFAWALFRKVASTTKGNVLFSPSSIRTALLMVHAGARGKTAEQMARVLCLPKPAKGLAGRLGQALGGVLGKLRPAGGAGQHELRQANGLWVQKGWQVRPEFVALVRDRYGAGAGEADFARAPEAARKAINAWGAKQTRNMIREALPRGTVDGFTRFVVTSAVCFKGQWASRFPKADTKNLPFHLRRGVRTVVPTMTQIGRFAYLAGPGFRALELPYKGNALSMVVLLPGQDFALPALCQALTADRLKTLLARLGPAKPAVRVSLPRLALSARLRPEQALIDLGMRDVFSLRTADLTGISPRRPLALRCVAQAARIELTEEGTRAAAVTAAGGFFGEGPAPRKPKIIEFRADQPFLFLIRHKPRGTIIFLGLVANPKQP